MLRVRAALLLHLVPLWACVDPGDPGAWVPATVDEDPSLPSRSLDVVGHLRQVHLRTFGAEGAPPLFVIPGSASDLRAYAPLAALSDHYRVVMWDLRGNGLSERVPAEELGFEAMAEELEAMWLAEAGGEPATFIGHSWSAAFVALYLARHPEHVRQAVLIEPPGLKDSFQDQVGLALDLMAPGYLDLVWSVGSAPLDHVGLDYQMLGMLQSGVRNFYCDPDDHPPWPVWRPGALALITWEAAILKGTSLDYDFTPGVGDFTGEVLIVGTECSPIGTEFQTATNLTVFQDARVLDIRGSGHRILTEQPEALLA
ncbi:MAG: alpha/beta hydrolase, partial [Deltaproteobacteria bacterium]|nr:alpha/beta hydrolase [Deltaproteobacteria bacterium]